MTRGSPASKVCCLVAAAFASFAPLTRDDRAAFTQASSFPGWPESYEGRPLTALPLSERDAAFARDFPGRIGRFHDGQRDIIIRYLTEPTRRLHPASDCLRGVGYAITPVPARRAPSGVVTSCLKAERHGQTFTVCESVRNTRGDHWPDVSSWYWAALVQGATGPWWSFVVAEDG